MGSVRLGVKLESVYFSSSDLYEVSLFRVCSKMTLLVAKQRVDRARNGRQIVSVISARTSYKRNEMLG